jgi:hypothetical protein
MSIQDKISNINQYCITRKDYHELLTICSKMKECCACVYIYDTMKKNNIECNQETFDILDKLHRKDLVDCNTLRVPSTGNRTLAPKRRIHKIMKGQITKDNYSNALRHKQIVIDFLNKNPDIKTNPRRHWVAKQVSKQCNLDVRTVRYIITHLKRIKFIDKSTIPIIKTTLRALDHPSIAFLSKECPIKTNSQSLPVIDDKSSKSIFNRQSLSNISPKNYSFDTTIPLDRCQLLPPLRSNDSVTSHKLPSIHKHIKKKTYGKSNIQNFF